MRVGLISPYDLGRHGGVQDQVLQLAAWLEAAGHEVAVAGPGTGPVGTTSLGEPTVITVNGAAAPIRLDPWVGRAIAGAMRGCDVVHVHEPLMPMTSLGRSLSRSASRWTRSRISALGTRATVRGEAMLSKTLKLG